MTLKLPLPFHLPFINLVFCQNLIPNHLVHLQDLP